MTSLAEPDPNMLEAVRGTRLVEARRDIAVTLHSFGGAAFLVALVLIATRFITRDGLFTRRPERLIHLGVAVSAAALIGFVWVLALRFRRGWRKSALLGAILGAAGLGCPFVAVALIGSPETRAENGSWALPLVILGALAGLLGFGVFRGRRWARFVLAVAAGLTTVALGFSATGAIRAAGDVWLSAILAGAAVPAILLFIALCMPGVAVIFPSKAGAPPQVTAMKRSSPLFLAGSRVATAFFVLVWALLTAAAAVNLPRALHRSRQRLTMTHIREVATAVEAYAADNHSYPDAKTIEELERCIEPTYSKALPRTDAWGWPLEYKAVFKPAEGKPPAAGEYVIRSPGRDGVYEKKDPAAYNAGAVSGFDRDLVFSNGSFSQWPEPAAGP